VTEGPPPSPIPPVGVRPRLPPPPLAGLFFLSALASSGRGTKQKLLGNQTTLIRRFQSVKFDEDVASLS